MEKIFLKGKEIILIGTAHVSEESAELVRKTIEKEKPDFVGIELCRSRFGQLKSEAKWQNTNIGQIIAQKKTYLFLINLLLANIQRRMGQELGVKPGAEMIAACNIAKEKEIPIVLLDRDVQITLRRAFSFMGLWEKIKIAYSILMGFFSTAEEKKISKELVEKMKEKDMMSELMEELSKNAPTIKRVLVDERDAFIANAITNSPGKKIVAVIGAGHLEGVKQQLGKEINIRELLEVPKKKNYLSLLLKIGIPALFAAILIFAFFFKGITFSIQLFAWWFLITGALSALGAALARAHPISIITAFLAAPFTTLHPALAAGWFAGYAELRVRNPKVKDFEELNKLNSFGDFYRNQVTRVLLVTAFANIGAMVGVVIALPYLIKLLAL